MWQKTSFTAPCLTAYQVLGPRHRPTNRGERSDDAEIKTEMGRDRHWDKWRDDRKAETVTSEMNSVLNWWCQIHIFCLIVSLGSGRSTVRPSYEGLLVSSHTLLHSPPPTDTHSDYPHPSTPTSALRAIIIMPCINNASQYINNASLQHGWGAGGGGGGWGASDGLFLAQHIIS